MKSLLLVALGLGLVGVRGTYAQEARSTLPIEAGKTPEVTYGHYVGSLSPEFRSHKIAASLDLFIGQELERAAQIHAILKVKLGKKGEGESVSYYFSNVTFSFEESVLTFSSGDRSPEERANPMRMVLKASGKEFNGIFEILSDGTKGEIQFSLVSPFPTDAGAHSVPLKNNIPSKASRPPNEIETLVENLGKARSQNLVLEDGLPTLSGVYQGTCGKTPAQLYLQSQWTFADKRNTNEDSLQNYEIFGALALQNCPEAVIAQKEGSSAFCVTANFTSGHFHYASGQLRLKGLQGPLRCRFENGAWQCEGEGRDNLKRECSFIAPNRPDPTPQKKLYGKWLESHRWAMEKMPEADAIDHSDDMVPQDLRGDYFGYLYLQERERLQGVRLSLLAAKGTTNLHNPERLFLLPSLSLFLGSAQSPEVLIFPLDKRPFLQTFPHLLFTGDNDVIIQVTQWTRGAIEGLYFSKAHGLVGPITLMKGRLAMKSYGLEALPALSGNYSNQDWSLRLEVGTQQAQSLAPQWLVEGMLESSQGVLAGAMIERGSYHPYTGELYLKIEDTDPKRGKRVLSGRVNSDDSLSLWIPGRIGIGMPIPNYTTSLLKREKP